MTVDTKEVVTTIAYMIGVRMSALTVSYSSSIFAIKYKYNVRKGTYFVRNYLQIQKKCKKKLSMWRDM